MVESELVNICQVLIKCYLSSGCCSLLLLLLPLAYKFILESISLLWPGVELIYKCLSVLELQSMSLASETLVFSRRFKQPMLPGIRVCNTGHQCLSHGFSELLGLLLLQACYLCLPWPFQTASLFIPYHEQLADVFCLARLVMLASVSQSSPVVSCTLPWQNWIFRD